MSSYLTRLQTDIQAVLKADTYFANIGVVVIDSLAADADADAILAGTKKVNGKAGLAVKVRLPRLQKTSKLVEGLLRANVTVSVEEIPEINNGSFGVGKSASEVAERIYDVLDRVKLGWSHHELKASEEEAAVQIDGNTRYYDLEFYTFSPTPGLVAVATPTVTVGATTVTLACGTSGASIYYTTDGVTFPSAANSATLYSPAFAKPASGTLIRVCAFKTGLRQSHVVHQVIA